MDAETKDAISRINTGTETLTVAGAVWVSLEDYEIARRTVNTLVVENSQIMAILEDMNEKHPGEIILENKFWVAEPL